MKTRIDFFFFIFHVQKIMENKAKILWKFSIQRGKQVLTDQVDIVVIYKNQKSTLVKDATIPSDKRYQETLGRKLRRNMRS